MQLERVYMIRMLLEKWYIVFPLVVFTVFFLYMQKHWLQTERYTICSKKVPVSFDGFVIVQLSDLHSEMFGKKNRRLIRRIRQIQPDLIVMTGDMIHHNDSSSVFLLLATELTKEYPVYFVTGNHEQHFSIREPRKYHKYMAELKKAGVMIIDNAKVEHRKNDDAIHLFGFSIPRCYYTQTSPFAKRRVVFQCSEMDKLPPRDPQRYNILLTHNPAYFPVYCRWGADLIFAGHFHGGVIRLPGLGGILSPERKLFPKFSGGKYTMDGHVMVVNRGLGGKHTAIRVFNRPDISVITLHRKVH